MTKQLNHVEFKERQVNFSPNIVLVLENLEHEENIGSAFRLADAFGIRKILIVTNKELEVKKVEKTARNCTKNVPLRDCDFSQYEGVALIVGNEREGVSQYALDNSAFSVHIDMYGVNSSINVSTALAIALYKCSEDYLLKKRY